MIHHATKKKLADKGIEIKEMPEGSDFKYAAFWSQDPNNLKAPSVELYANDAKTLAEAIVAARMAVIEYHVSFEQSMEDGSISVTVGIKNPREVGTVEDIDDLHAALPDILAELSDEEAEEVAAQDAADVEEEDAKGGSVVPDVFKKRYAEAGHPGTCGDWLANELKARTTLLNGKLDVDAMTEIARLNGVDLAKLNTTTPGWQGRYRMTARNMMVKIVAKQGYLAIASGEEGDSIKAPGDWVLANQPKVKEAGDKKAARAAKSA